ncbi:GNAT family N-acetyltransferase [Muriicola soli]|uniref:GNAT family N-acetyltransferase n=1 Tax=Muriicola soli TaxID=2507538 RepID=A0A411E8L6_9FLAO|nr:GNAT family N-acetyltransferase [Muriicola soli]QBA63873.1 GNAT family N-acetyltransferase [Muriicola soli]
MLQYSYNFIFDLLLKREAPLLYRFPLYNKVTHTEIDVPTKIRIPKDIKVVRVQNIPGYFELDLVSSDLANTSVDLHQGFALDLSKYKSEKEYMAEVLSQRNQKNLYNKKKKLETSGKIDYRVFYGDPVNETNYHDTFDEFYRLLKARFNQKKILNRDLPQWDSLRARILPMIRAKQASIFVIYNHDKPISITLNFHLENALYSHIQAFDINYNKFNLPDISMLKQLEWCFTYSIRLYDLMLGYTYYKEKWSNCKYRFKAHIFYKQGVFRLVYVQLLISLWKAKLYFRKNVLPPRLSTDRVLFLLRGGNR